MDNEIKILGIDEAGRGPVIGPMTVCAFLIKDKSIIPYFQKIKIKSSKLLSQAKRQKLYKIFLKLKRDNKVNFQTIKISHSKINFSNLNFLYNKAIISLIKKFLPQKIYLDAPVNPNGILKYSKNLKSLIYKSKTFLGDNDFLICENFADEKYPVVSAASIVAKVVRDRQIKKLHQKYNCDFGSGYCHDKKTIAFLKNYYNKNSAFPKETRLKWSSFLQKIKSL
jgi:ribonuclease HII